MNKLNQLSQLQLKSLQLHSIGAHSKFNQGDSFSWKLNNGTGTNQICTWRNLNDNKSNYVIVPSDATMTKCPTYSQIQSATKSNYTFNTTGTSNKLVKYSTLSWTSKLISIHLNYVIYNLKSGGFRLNFSGGGSIGVYSFSNGVTGEVRGDITEASGYITITGGGTPTWNGNIRSFQVRLVYDNNPDRILVDRNVTATNNSLPSNGVTGGKYDSDMRYYSLTIHAYS